MAKPLTSCPHLGLADDPTLTRTVPDEGHRCYAQDPSAEIDSEYQRAYCLAAAYQHCSFYFPPSSRSQPPDEDEEDTRTWQIVYLGSVGLILLIVAIVYGRTLLFPPALPAIATPTTPEASATVPASPTPVPDTLSSAAPPEQSTPTPEPGGRNLTLVPSAGNVAWWSSGDARRSHAGDSFLYAGYFDDQVFVSALQFDFSRVRRGAPIHAALLSLTGLRDDRFHVAAGGNWTVSILSPSAIASLSRTDFQALFNAPADLTLVPSLVAGDLQPHQVNTWQLDASALAWIEQQLLDGVTTLTLRIIGPTGGVDTLFAWDSGAGPASGGEAPTLLLSLGPPPATPPALPTQALVVATLTPTPENVLTVAANLLTATAIATTVGTYTPTPANVVTPTPIPANQATAQAIAFQAGLPPVVGNTPTPANTATATAQSLYATAIALTTGTFTPVPTNAITPRLITPTPVPENAVTAVIVMATATAGAMTNGTPTPLPYNVVIATVTPRPLLIKATPEPENRTTATMIAAQVTIIAMTTGTFTPIPTYAATPTPHPPPTPLPDRLPASLRGKILFISDRPMPGVGESTGVWAIDPDTGVLAYLTQGWVYSLAQSLELSSTQPEGVYKISVEPDDQRILQVWVYDPQYQVKTNVSQLSGMSYDPAWAPDGFRLVFVSQAPGNDEIYVGDRAGGQPQRLTFNDWEWDKHPSWSPDGSRIVFHSNRDVGRTQLWVMSADGSNQVRLLTSPYNDYAPIWIK